MTLFRFFKTTVLGLSLCALLTGISSAQTLTFGVVPQQAASRLAKTWIPFMEDLSARTQMDIRFATMKDIPSFEQCLVQGDYDIAYMNPYHYTVFHTISGYQAIAHQADKKLTGLLVVRKDDPAKGLADLEAARIAFPSPAAFGASVLPRAVMTVNGIAFEPVYVKSHDSVYKSVAAGLFKSGGGVRRTWNSIPAELQDQLRIIYTTEGYTPHAFATAPTIDARVADTLAAAMQDITTQRPDLLKAIGMSGIVAADDTAWDDVRALNLRHSQTEVSQTGGVTCRLD